MSVDRPCRQPERSACARRTIQRLAVRAGESDCRAAEEKPKGRGAVRDRLRSVGAAAYRHLRRGRAHHHGAPCLSRADRGQDQDPAAGVFRRHGRAAQGAGQRPQQGDAGGASRQAADARAGSVLERISVVRRRTTTRGCARSSIISASTTNSRASTDYYTSGRFDATLLKMLAAYDKVMAIILPTLRTGPRARPIRRSSRSARPPASCCRCR